MKILIDEKNIQCLICNQKIKRLCDLSRHISIKHQIKPIEYTLNYLLNNEIPKCLCGCGKDVKVYNYKINENIVGHTGGGFWQHNFNKDSEEYKNITTRIAESVSSYYKKNKVTRSDDTKKKYSDNLKNIMADPILKKQRIDKMIKTKHRQSKEGILQEIHWTKTKSTEEVEEINKRIGEKSSITKRNKFKLGLLESWNKGLDKNSDERVSKYSRENHYRYQFDKDIEYPKIFRDKEYRKFLLERQNGVCLINKTNNKLCLHHVDCDKTNCRPTNLIYVERSIHMKIHNSNGYRRYFNGLVEEFINSIDKSKTI